MEARAKSDSIGAAEPPPPRPPGKEGDRLRQLRAFCHAARSGSITKAARLCFLSQPAVSQQVSGLEREFGVRLFDRVGSRIALTPSGKRLYRLAMPVVEKMDRLPDVFAETYRNVPSSDLAVAVGQAVAVNVLPGLLKRFKDEHPGLRSRVKVGGGGQRLEWLRAFEVDVVLAAVDLPFPDLKFHPILTSEMVLITPEDHPLAGRESVGIREAAVYPAIVHRSGHLARQIGDLLLRQHGLSANLALEVDGWMSIKSYVEAGLGISVVPDLCLSEQDRVWRIPYTTYFPPRRYGALVRRDDILSLAAARFLRSILPSVPGGP